MDLHVPAGAVSFDTSPAPLTSIDRRASISHKELLHDYVLKARPVVLTDAVKDWPAMKKWTPQFFKEKYGHIEFQAGGYGRVYTLAEQIDLMKASTPENPAPYPCSLDMEVHFPELFPDIRPQLVFGRSDRTTHPLLPKAMLGGTIVHELHFGGTGSFFPLLHYDMLGMNTQITQILGQKEFYLYPPEQTPFVYPNKEIPRKSDVGNIFEPDLQRFPRFAEAKPIVAMLDPGETIYFPTGWWHATKIYGECVTYGRAVLNSTNWNVFMRECYVHWKQYHPFLALPGYLFGHTLGGVMSMMEAVGAP